MDIKEVFLKLTDRTYPHGTEGELLHLLPDILSKDQFGNLYIEIGDNPTTMFTSHLDTASSTVQKVNHKIEGKIISTDGSSILGADDKAGVTILLYMIENNIRGLYYFFLGEERGCIGSSKVAEHHKTNPLLNITKVVSFDRRGTDSIITHQLGRRCCSDEFAKELANQLNNIEKEFRYDIDPSGIYTDSAQFTQIYPECTNISVGYRNEHSGSEFQNIEHLELLAKAVTEVDWDNLPIKRNKTQDIDWEDDFEWGFSSFSNSNIGKSKQTNNNWTISYTFNDPIFQGDLCEVKINKYTKVPQEFKLTNGRIEYEEDKIYDFLVTMELDIHNFYWDGTVLDIEYMSGQTSKTKRTELAEYISELDFWKSLVDNK
jgi:hypothetical protein